MLEEINFSVFRLSRIVLSLLSILFTSISYKLVQFHLQDDSFVSLLYKLDVTKAETRRAELWEVEVSRRDLRSFARPCSGADALYILPLDRPGALAGNKAFCSESFGCVEKVQLGTFRMRLTRRRKLRMEMVPPGENKKLNYSVCIGVTKYKNLTIGIETRRSISHS